MTTATLTPKPIIKTSVSKVKHVKVSPKDNKQHIDKLVATSIKNYRGGKSIVIGSVESQT